MDCRLSNISEGHQKSVVSFLRFARQHRLQQLHAIKAAFHELQASRLTDDIFTIDEVVEMLDWLQTIIRSEVESEQMHLVHSTVLLMKQLFQQAEAAPHPISLNVNIPMLDDRNLLEEVSRFEQSTTGTISSGDIMSSSSLASQSLALASLGLRSTSLEPINWSTVKKSIDNGMELLKLSEEKTNPQPSQTCDHISVEACAEPTSANSAELDEGKEELGRLRDMLKKSEQELESKVSQTTPYKNLKRILQRKNEQLKDFRKRLSQYEKTDEEGDCARPTLQVD